jgi:hypothetical protein
LLLRKEAEVKLVVFLLAGIGAVLLLAGGVALAAVVVGNPGHDNFRGTDGPDSISGGRGDDLLMGTWRR